MVFRHTCPHRFAYIGVPGAHFRKRGTTVLLFGSKGIKLTNFPHLIFLAVAESAVLTGVLLVVGGASCHRLSREVTDPEDIVLCLMVENYRHPLHDQNFYIYIYFFIYFKLNRIA